MTWKTNQEDSRRLVAARVRGVGAGKSENGRIRFGSAFAQSPKNQLYRNPRSTGLGFPSTDGTV